MTVPRPHRAPRLLTATPGRALRYPGYVVGVLGEWGVGEGGGRAEVAATEARSPRHPVVRAGALGPQHGVHHLRLTRVAARWAVRSRRFPSEAPVQSKKKEVAQEVASASPKTTRKQLPDDVGRSLRGGRLLARGAPLGGGGVRGQAHRRWRADVDSPASPESPGGLVCLVGRHERCSFGPKKKGVRAGRTWGGPCGARPWSSGSYGSGVHRHACGGCARARGRRGGGELRGAIFDMWERNYEYRFLLGQRELLACLRACIGNLISYHKNTFSQLVFPKNFLALFETQVRWTCGPRVRAVLARVRPMPLPRARALLLSATE